MKVKKTGGFATLVLVAGAIWGGIVFGVDQNGGWNTVFNSASNIIPGPNVKTTTTKPSSGTVSATGDPTNYPYGTIQLSVTRTNGKISKVGLIQASASAGRDQAFPSLEQAAISANGTNFGNMSGATYTTDTFKQALNSAISKLP